MPAREKTSATFLAAAVVGRGAVGEAEFGGFAVGCSAGPRYKPVRGELMRRSSRFVNHTASAAQTTSPPGLTCLSQGAPFAPRGQAGLSPGFLPPPQSIVSGPSRSGEHTSELPSLRHILLR